MKSKSSCDKTSNNKYFDCPARMDDGRTFTDYRQNSTVNDMIRYSNNTMSSYEYRQFLIHNASKIMEVNNTYLKEKVGCDSCDYVEVPFQTTCTWNETFGKCSMTDPNGVGLRNIIHEKFTNGNDLGSGASVGSSSGSQMAFVNSAQNVGWNTGAYEPFESNLGVPSGSQMAYNITAQNIGPNSQYYPVENFATYKDDSK